RVHPDLLRLNGLKILQGSGERVKQTQRHRREMTFDFRWTLERRSNAVSLSRAGDRGAGGAQALPHQNHVVDGRNYGESKRGVKKRKSCDVDPAYRIYLEQQNEEHRRHLG